MSSLLELITSEDDAVRNTSLERACADLSADQLLSECAELDRYRRDESSLYNRVRALFFLSAVHRYHLPPHFGEAGGANIPSAAVELLLSRRFQEAVDVLLGAQRESGPGDSVSSALAEGYHRLAFQTLADQVRQCVRTVRGNQWMFRTGHPTDIPLRVRRELIPDTDSDSPGPVLREQTPVRMDFSHSGWSDIFFLGMDYPEGARVINASIDLAVVGRHSTPKPPVECVLRVIDRPVLRLVSIDLNASAELTHIHEVFDFARDYLGLLKAAVIAAGLIPAGMEGCRSSLDELFHQMIGPGFGLEIVSRVNDIPKGSRLAVSTNLLGGLISLCMRATGQIRSLTGPLEESERRLVAARAILGEWLGGSGGGWQDSGGVWPGIKLITGATAGPGDPEYGVSRGQLMPQHHVYSRQEVSAETLQSLQDSLVLVHGGMAQNVGPILEMVTERYLLRSEKEWKARQSAVQLLDEIQIALKNGDIPRVGRATHRNFFEPLQEIIPWCTNAFTEELVRLSQSRFGSQFHGFWMLGGMAGGGMGFIFDPAVRPEAKEWLRTVMPAVREKMKSAVPFAMDPVVYDFAVNEVGTCAELRYDGFMPRGYYALAVPPLLRTDTGSLSRMTRAELQRVGQQCRSGEDSSETARLLLDRLLPAPESEGRQQDSLNDLLAANGFDETVHRRTQEEIRQGTISLSGNRLTSNVTFEDALPEDVIDATGQAPADVLEVGTQALQNGEVAVVTLAAGVGSRWTQGAGVVKALNPFCRMGGQFRSFLDVHRAKARKLADRYGAQVPHVIATGYLTDRPIRECFQDDDAALYFSRGSAVGLRTVPMVRDLQFWWEEMPQQALDEQQEKMRASIRAALINWAKGAGEGSDYTDNLPLQCMHPAGHWYEIPGLLRSGAFADVLRNHPSVRYLMIHNVDTLGAVPGPQLCGHFLKSDADFLFEVVRRRVADHGGGLARVNGRLQLVEGLAMPAGRNEFDLSYYNTLTTWVSVDALLKLFGITRSELDSPERITEGIRQVSNRLPTYLTLKDVKKRWGRGQEDVYPVAQCEKLWGDVTTLTSVRSAYAAVTRGRGQQLKDPAQLDGWLRDGSCAAVEALCRWDDESRAA